MQIEGVPNPWDRYWEQLSDRQRLFAVHADEYVSNLESTIGLAADAAVLDFGCGFGFVSRLLAPRVGQVVMWDGSGRMREAAARRATGANVRVCDRSELELASSSERFELILVNSVVQYLTAEEFAAWLGRWRALLSPGGRIVVSDVVPDEPAVMAELAHALRFARRNRFLLRALAEAADDARRYWRTRRLRPLLQLSRGDLVRHGRAAGLEAAFVPNLTALRNRTTVVYVADDARDVRGSTSPQSPTT